MTIAMIIAGGENEVAVPCLTFATVVEAERFLTDRFGPADEYGRWSPDDCELSDDDAEDFFKSYYGGCGGIQSFRAQEVQHGKPIVGFDLD